jgi:hypothetical protein
MVAERQGGIGDGGRAVGRVGPAMAAERRSGTDDGYCFRLE